MSGAHQYRTVREVAQRTGSGASATSTPTWGEAPPPLTMPSPPPRRVRQPGHQRSGGRTRSRAWRPPPPFPKTLSESCRQARKGPGGARWGKSHRPSPLEALEGLPRATTYVKKSAAAPLSIRYPIHSEALRGRPPPPVWGEEREGKAGEVSEGLAPLTKKERRQHASTHSGFRQLAAQLKTHSPLRSGPLL